MEKRARNVWDVAGTLLWISACVAMGFAIGRLIAAVGW